MTRALLMSNSVRRSHPQVVADSLNNKYIMIFKTRKRAWLFG